MTTCHAKERFVAVKSCYLLYGIVDKIHGLDILLLPPIFHYVFDKKSRMLVCGSC
jgi:hypothetical protein